VLSDVEENALSPNAVLDRRCDGSVSLVYSAAPLKPITYHRWPPKAYLRCPDASVLPETTLMDAPVIPLGSAPAAYNELGGVRLSTSAMNSIVKNN
jgi:hypothetical protein